jgi:heterotetrameric sarcosine oxidase gamma subunit
MTELQELSVERQSVAAQLGLGSPVAASLPGLTVRVLDPASQLLVTGGPALAPNTVEGSDPCRGWLAPNRCLVVAKTVAAPALDAPFVSDVTDGLALFEIAGPRAADIITMGCTIDPSALAPGHAAQTIFAGLKVILYGHGVAVRLHVERPLARFLLDWLRQAASAIG